MRQESTRASVIKRGYNKSAYGIGEWWWSENDAIYPSNYPNELGVSIAKGRLVMDVSDFETARITLDKTAVEQLIKVLTVLKNRLGN